MSEEFDPCECVFSQEAAMQRLLSLLRQGQSYCTDNECTDDPPLSNLPAPSPVDTTYIMLALWALFAMLMFFMRPSSLRNNEGNTAGKPSAIANNNNNNQPPPPPPSM